MATVVHVKHGDGSHSVGVEIDGVYVPFGSVTAARVQHLQDRAHDLGKRLEAGNDQAAIDANDQLPIRASGERQPERQPEQPQVYPAEPTSGTPGDPENRGGAQ